MRENRAPEQDPESHVLVIQIDFPARLKEESARLGRLLIQLVRCKQRFVGRTKQVL